MDGLALASGAKAITEIIKRDRDSYHSCCRCVARQSQHITFQQLTNGPSLVGRNQLPRQGRSVLGKSDHALLFSFGTRGYAKSFLIGLGEVGGGVKPYLE